MGQFNLPKKSDVQTPAAGKVAVFASASGNLATKDSAGNVREYSPTPLESETMVYGVRWDSVDDVMQPGVIVNGSFLATDYQNFPIQEECGRGLLTGTGEWTKLNSRDTTKLPDGSAATIDGSAGQVMTQIPRFYQVIKRDGDYVYFLISKQPFSFGGTPAWVPLGFGSKAFRYCGAFQGVALTDSADADVGSCVLDTSGYSTNANPNPFSNRTRAQFRTQCAATGDAFHQYDWGLHDIIGILFLTKYKTWNSQEVLPGYSEESSWDYAKTYPAGLTTSLGDNDGSIWDADRDMYVANSFLGIENFYGHVWVWVDGINVDNRTDPAGECRVWVAFDPASFADDTTTDYIDSGHAPDFGDDDDYIKDILGQGKYCPFYPAVIGDGADSATYITDHHWNNAGGWRVPRVGGHLSLGARVGFRALYADRSSSYATASFAVRLSA